MGFVRSRAQRLDMPPLDGFGGDPAAHGDPRDPRRSQPEGTAALKEPRSLDIADDPGRGRLDLGQAVSHSGWEPLVDSLDQGNEEALGPYEWPLQPSQGFNPSPQLGVSLPIAPKWGPLISNFSSPPPPRDSGPVPSGPAATSRWGSPCDARFSSWLFYPHPSQLPALASARVRGRWSE